MIAYFCLFMLIYDFKKVILSILNLHPSSFKMFLVDFLINSLKIINRLIKEIVYSVKKCQIFT